MPVECAGGGGGGGGVRVWRGRYRSGCCCLVIVETVVGWRIGIVSTYTLRCTSVFIRVKTFVRCLMLQTARASILMLHRIQSPKGRTTTRADQEKNERMGLAR